MIVNTDRLIIRLFTMDDVDEIHELFCDKYAMKMVGMYSPNIDMELTKRRIGRWMENKRHHAIVLKETNRVIGYIAINLDPDEVRDDVKELAFALIDRYRSKGYMKEAIAGVIEQLRIEGIKELWACCFQENKESENIIKTMGFKLERQGKYQPPNDKEHVSLEFKMSLE